MHLSYTLLPDCRYSLDRMGKQVVIGVKEHDNLSSTYRKACVERRRLAAIIFQHRSNSVLVAVDDVIGVVGGTIIDHDDLDIRIGLVKGAVYGLAQKAAVVVVVDNDAH